MLKLAPKKTLFFNSWMLELSFILKMKVFKKLHLSLITIESIQIFLRIENKKHISRLWRLIFLCFLINESTQKPAAEIQPRNLWYGLENLPAAICTACTLCTICC